MLLFDCDVCSGIRMLDVSDEQTGQSAVEYVSDMVVELSRGFTIKREATVVTSQSIAVPKWALVHPTSSDANWNLTSAQLAVGITPTSSATTNTSSPTPSPPNPPPKRPPYVVIAVSATLALFLLIGMAVWLYRRRNRISSSPRPPDFEIDGGPSSGLLPKADATPPSWKWWRKSSPQPKSDPGKIDAWRYPFDYEPVSTGPSTRSGGSGRGTGLYDPYHLAPRASMDTLGMRAQVSSGTLGYSSSTQNLRATPSPVPGTTPVQAHTTLPAFGQPPNYTYGQTVSYTYPYAQPVPSSSAGSPMSPHYVQSQVQSPSMVYGHVQSPTHVQGSHGAQPTQAAHFVQGSSRGREQVVMIPIEQMSPDQIEQLRLQFPDLRIRQKKRRPRRRQDAETDHERYERARTHHGERRGADHERTRKDHERTRTDHERTRTDHERTRAEYRDRVDPPRTRPRSWSVPVQVETEDDEWDGRPRNGVELREKYEGRRRSRDRVVVSVGIGGSGAVRIEGGGVRVEGADGAGAR
ncbi:unnamed protein product, partial [Rhizoctonia solani]